MKDKAKTLFFTVVTFLAVLGVSYGRFHDRKLCDSMCHHAQCACTETCPKERGQ